MKDLNPSCTTAIKSGDRIHHVEDQEILYAMSRFRDNKGSIGGGKIINSEPSGASAIAMIPRVVHEAKVKHDLIATINTGNGIERYAYQHL